ncbi:MAG: glycosyltransferase family 39 protein [Planctomycetia bacterium]|nr:glycosyltransferase family 39 protein [Planctomycetia bacterium]
MAQALNSSTSEKSAFQLGWQGIGIILLYGVTLLIGYHLSQRTLTMHEVIFAQPAKEMLASGDFLVPRVGGVVFGDKPLLTMWLMAASIELTGSLDEWVVRLPSSLAALLTAVVIGMTAARWFGKRVGILAGLAQLTSYYVLQMATLAESDMLLICSVTLAICFFAWVQIPSPIGQVQGRWTPWVFGFLVGLTFMIKGPIGVVFIGLTVGSWMVLNRQWSLLRFFFHPGGLLVFLLMALPYPLLSGLRYPPILDEWLLHNWGRFKGDLTQVENREPLWFYFLNLPMVLLPWTPCLIIALMDRKVWKHPMVWLALCWFLPGVLFLSCSAWKWKHYMSPLLPGLTIIAAVGLERWLYVTSQVLQRYWRPLMLGTLLLGIAGVAVIYKTNPLGELPIAILVSVASISAMVVMELNYRKLHRWSVPALFTMIWMMIAGVFIWVLPVHDHCRVQVEFADRINQRQELDKPLHLVNLSYHQIIYYLKKPIVRLDKIKQFQSLAEHIDDDKYVLIKQKDISEIQSLGMVQPLDSCPNTRRKTGPGDNLVLVRLQTVLPAQFNVNP